MIQRSSQFGLILGLICCLVLGGWGQQGAGTARAAPAQQGIGADPPQEPVKLIFIHHSTGENWLEDGYGNLGSRLAENNYYVSDTNYGWGPDGIGDRTDIPDWLEWFRGETTPEIAQALFEEGAQHSSYSRPLPDPGGENQIILFKSCFPNSDLEGSPADPPTAEGWLSVGHAKYVYNQLLGFFSQHPEKLFVVITAPPLSDSSNADNARGFNLWLVNDWLSENDYPYHNVAVFDFYNVLTGREGRHTYENGQEVYQAASRNTLFYPSGDDHPSRKGSQKATENFVPLLNYYYNRWQAENPAPLAAAAPDPADQDPDQREGPPLSGAGLLDDFEGAPPSASGGWEAFWDEGTPSQVNCGLAADIASRGGVLQADYQVAPYSWGTCGLFYEAGQDWSQASGLTFLVHSDQAGESLHVDLYAEGPGGRESYLYQLPLDSEIRQGWVEVGIPWESFQRVEWEEDAGAPFTRSNAVSGLAFGFGMEEEEIEGTVWLDDVGFLGFGETPGPDAEQVPEAAAAGGAEEGSAGWVLPAAGFAAALAALAGGAYLIRRRAAER